MSIVKHSFDGRYDIYLDTDDIEIVKLMLEDKKTNFEVRQKFKASGYAGDVVVALLTEAEKLMWAEQIEIERRMFKE